MLRIFLIISLVFSLSLFSNMSYVYAQSGGPPGKRVCSCPAGSCACPKEDACYGSSITSSGDKLVCRGNSSEVTGTTPADTPPKDKRVCICHGDDCVCPKNLACEGATSWGKESDGSMIPKLVCAGTSGGDTAIDTPPFSTPPIGTPATGTSRDKRVCRCFGDTCACPKEDTCATADDVIDKETGASIPAWMSICSDVSGGDSCSCDIAECVCPKDLACDGATSWDKDSVDGTIPKLVCGGVSGGTGAAPTDTPPPPPGIPGCRCGGEGCTCPKAFACGGAHYVTHWDKKSGDVLSTEWVCGGGSGGLTGADIAAENPEDRPVCSCGGTGNNCVCTKEGACGYKVTYNKTTDTFFCTGKWWDTGTDVVTPVPFGEPSPDEWPDACSCPGNNCACPKDLACGGAVSSDKVCGGVSGGGTGAATPAPFGEPSPDEWPDACSCPGDNCACPKDLACIGATSWDKEFKLVCGGVPGSGTGAATPAPFGEPSPDEWSNACSCSGANCVCLKEGVCGVERWRAEITILEARIAKAGPEGAELLAQVLSGFREALKEAEKQCK